MRRSIAICLLLASLVALAIPAPVGALARTITFLAPPMVQDASMRDGEFAGFNFGGGPMLEVGCMGGIYAEHHCVSLIRFNIPRSSYSQARWAKLRLYKPKCFVQTAPVQVRIFEVASANAGWFEGSSICSTDGRGCCWCAPGSGKTWAGAEGCSRKGVDYLTPALATKVAPDDRGLWMEFSIPIALVRKWAVRPETNAGLLITSGNDHGQWGDHVFFYSSEHYNREKRPQLVIGRTGKGGFQGVVGAEDSRGPRLPSDDYLDRWLKANMRLAGFTTQARMTREQSRVFCYMDTTVRRDQIIGLYQAPLASQFDEIERLAAANDADGVKRKLGDVWNSLLFWEYIRETSWYTAGPLAEVLTPRQLAILFGGSIFGRMEESAKEKGETIWQAQSGDKLNEGVKSTIDSTARNLGLSQEQMKPLEPKLSEYERQEHKYLARFDADFAQVKAMLGESDNEKETLRCVKSLHQDHERFLYYQSVYSAPRWNLFTQNSPAIPFGKWIVQGRKRMYNQEAVKRQLKAIKSYDPAGLGSD